MSKKKSALDWGASMKRIEEIVRILEKGDSGLDESIELFEEGTLLVDTCRNALDKAELKVKKLIEREGGAEELDFSAGEEGEAE